jgi:hypothetical protein
MTAHSSKIRPGSSYLRERAGMRERLNARRERSGERKREERDTSRALRASQRPI